MTDVCKVICGLLLMATLVPALGGCDAAPVTSDRDVQLIEFEQIRELQARSSKKHKLVIVDVRPASHYVQGYIAGAINIPLPMIIRNDPRLADADTIVTYGSEPADPLATAAAKRMLALGYENVQSYRGGLEMWQKLGGAVESLQ